MKITKYASGSTISRYSCQCRRKLRPAAARRVGRRRTVATAWGTTDAGGAGFTSIVELTPESLSWSCTCCDGLRTARSGTDIR
ncbi:hypothetical protein GCM10009741_01780 [Kribbella lupini]|uniref:Uncharacterized protein n=1 Tax=Kribbella lupini TaxID=291602 RepID=A0ABN2A0V8_9ACTN